MVKNILHIHGKNFITKEKFGYPPAPLYPYIPPPLFSWNFSLKSSDQRQNMKLLKYPFFDGFLEFKSKKKRIECSSFVITLQFSWFQLFVYTLLFSRFQLFVYTLQCCCCDFFCLSAMLLREWILLLCLYKKISCQALQVFRKITFYFIKSVFWSEIMMIQSPLNKPEQAKTATAFFLREIYPTIAVSPSDVQYYAL